MLGWSHRDVVIVIIVVLSWLWLVSATIELRAHVWCNVCPRIVFKYVICGPREMNLPRMGVMTAVHLIAWLSQLVNGFCHSLLVGAVTIIVIHVPLECPSL